MPKNIASSLVSFAAEVIKTGIEMRYTRVVVVEQTPRTILDDIFGNPVTYTARVHRLY